MLTKKQFEWQKNFWRRIKKRDISSWRPNSFTSYCLNSPTYNQYISQLCAKRKHRTDLPLDSKKWWKIRKCVYKNLTLKVWEVSRFFDKLLNNFCWFIYIPDLIGMVSESVIFMYRNFDKIPMHKTTRQRLYNFYTEMQSLHLNSNNDRMDTYKIPHKIMYEFESHQRLDIYNIIDEWDDHEVVQEITTSKE